MLYEPLVSSENDRIQHALVEQEVSHPLRDDDVHLLHGELDFFDFSFDDRNDVLKSMKKSTQ